MNATFPCYEEPDLSEDESTAMLRAQLRDMYQWIPDAPFGEPNVTIVCRPASPPPVLAKHVAAAAAELQTQIAERAHDDVARIREINAKHAIPGYEQLEVWPEHLAPYA